MKLIILDRDGVINEDSNDYIKSPDEWIPINALKKARDEPESIEKEVGMVMRLIGR